ncbi:DUF1304 domain-containing protein [Salinibacterium sp. dk2585]|uniref:DUF1304 domain-containing protein n=1 Tax=unclassified Salinibacterium TaxID=2632331 RepID=UPI0011C246D2|nr:DUF1304 domain-containing protein [Salinibacterium sp. dk2585]TXK52957.1 DUF1304 domain-containing protein [Salinibacterium sp. dk5596]
MVVVGLVLAGFAALIHVFIFYLESIAWTRPRARATFGMTEAEAEATKELAFNQGAVPLLAVIALALGLAL